MKTSLKMMAVVVTLMLAATACGGGASGDDQVLIDAAAAAIRDEGDLPEGVDVDCAAEALVVGLGGAETLEADFGITVESIEADGDPLEDIELSRDAALSLTDNLWDCGLEEAMVSEMAADLGEEPARCLVGELDESILQNMMAAELMNPADADAVASEAQNDFLSSMIGAMGECDISLDALG